MPFYYIKGELKTMPFYIHTRGIKSKFLSIADLDIITFYYIQGEFKGKGINVIYIKAKCRHFLLNLI